MAEQEAKIITRQEEQELDLLAAILIDYEQSRKYYGIVFDVLKATDFISKSIYGDIYQAAQELFKEGLHTDPVSVRTRLSGTACEVDTKTLADIMVKRGASIGYEAINTYILTLAKNIISDYAEHDKLNLTADEIAERTKERDIRINNLYSHEIKSNLMSEYMKKQFTIDQSTFMQFDGIKTGLNVELYAGLYIIGAMSGAGKTTFVLQMADNIAQSGKHVIFFSLEQSKFELSSKSITRIVTAEHENRRIQTSASTSKGIYDSMSIRKGKYTYPEDRDNVDAAIVKYSNEIAPNIEIIDSGMKANVDEITQYAERYISVNEDKPVIIVDYLQILQQPESIRRTLGEKELIDYSITNLKRLSARYKIPVIVIASFNRSSYSKENIDYSAFSGSACIEYSADVLLTMELESLDNLTSKPDYDELKNKEQRDVIVKCLKNRYGTGYTNIYTYTPANELFEYNENGIEELKRVIEARNGKKKK